MKLSDLFRQRDQATTTGTPDPFTAYQGAPGTSRYGEAALQREADAVAHAGEGVRNHTLNSAIFSLAQLIASGHLDADRVHATLTNAARLNGLPEAEIAGTLRSGYNAGIRAPRDVPAPWEVEEAPEVTILRLVPDGDTTPVPEDTTIGEPEADEDTRIRAWVHDHLPRVDWHALWEEDDAEEWIIEPLLPARRLVALYSAPKVGKSLLMLELACAVAAGGWALGHQVDRPRRVLYVDYENDPKGDVRSRLQAMGKTPGDLDNLYYLSFPTLAALDSERGALELLAAVTTYDCELVVVDTVSRAVQGDENENDTWLNFYRHTGLRLKQAGVGLVRLDHAGKDETKGQRGGSAKVGDVDAVWRMSRVAEEVFQLECEANRMPVSEKVLTLDRGVEPLRHTVRGTTRASGYEAGVEEAIRVMDEIGFTLEATKGSGSVDGFAATYGIGRNVAREAQQRRRDRAAVTTI